MFLVTFISLYGGVHVYAYWRLRSAFPVGTRLMVLMAAMIAAPVAIRTLEHAGFEEAARALAWPSNIWMGSLFLFTSFLAVIDIIRLISRRIAIFSPSFRHRFSPAAACRSALYLSIIASVYSLYEARNIRTEHLSVVTAKLPPGIQRIRIVQISDVHIGLLFRESRLERVLRAVRAASPDILVSTGDLVDGRLSKSDDLSGLKRLSQMFVEVSAPLGKFAVAGNHEVYAGIEQAVAFTQKSGFTVLRDETVTLPNGMVIIGLNDQGRRKPGKAKAAADEDRLLSTAPGGFRVLLKHRPVMPEKSDGRFDLQLSGHTHKGQLLPFYPLTWTEFSIHSGTTETPKSSTIHVSRGSGTWGPPMRFLAPPEVTVIDLVPAK